MFKPREVHTFVQDSGKRQILRKEAGKLVFPNCLVEFIVLKHSVMQNRVRVIFNYLTCLSSVQAMQYEIDHGVPVIQSEAVAGATRFTTGAGKGGKFS